MTEKKKKRLLWSGVGTLMTILIIGVFFIGAEPVSKLLTPRQENFTELYFEDHLRLPKVLMRGFPTTISFTIHNLEGQDMEYPIKVTVQDDADPANITTSSSSIVSVPKNHSKTIPLEIALPIDAPNRQKIQIELENLQQSIHLWASVATPSATPQLKNE